MVARYVLADLVSSAAAWTLFYLYRNVVLEPAKFGYAVPVEFDTNYFKGLVLIPLFWFGLHTVMGGYREIHRRYRTLEFGQTLLISLIGVIIIFFVLLLDDEVASSDSTTVRSSPCSSCTWELLPGRPRQLLGRTAHLIVVDDGSRDDTARVAAEHGAWPIRLPTNRGGGFALRTGFAAARRLGARHVITLDAGQHRFEGLPAVLAPLRDGTAHVMIGSRRLGRSLDTSRLRNLGVRVFSAVVSRLTGQRITDCASGLRGLEVASLGRLSLCQVRHHTAELIIEAARHGLVIVEVPITIASRRRGTSKKGSSVAYALWCTATILSTWLRR